MENTIRFRNALNGYHKDDVNRYIKEADMNYTAALDSLQNTVNAGEARIRELEEALAGTEHERDTEKKDRESLALEKAECDRLLTETRASRDTLAAEKEQTDAELTRLRQAYTELEAALAARESAFREKTTELEDALTAEKARAEAEMERIRQELTQDENGIAYKSQMYDKLSGQIGDILLGANRDADEILTAAKDEADRLRMETMDELEKKRAEVMEEMAHNRSVQQEELSKLRSETEADAEQIRERLIGTSHKLMGEISDELRTNSESCLKELATCLTELNYETQTLLQTFQVRYAEMQDRLQYYQSAALDNVEQKIHALDTVRSGMNRSST